MKTVNFGWNQKNTSRIFLMNHDFNDFDEEEKKCAGSSLNEKFEYTLHLTKAYLCMLAHCLNR